MQHCTPPSRRSASLHCALEHAADVFPVFQYELGGTWLDDRHTGPWTQHDTARYLVKLGYDLYLMGHYDTRPVLLPVDPKAFDEASCYEGVVRKVPQGALRNEMLGVLLVDLEADPILLHRRSSVLQELPRPVHVVAHAPDLRMINFA